MAAGDPSSSWATKSPCLPPPDKPMPRTPASGSVSRMTSTSSGAAAAAGSMADTAWARRCRTCTSSACSFAFCAWAGGEQGWRPGRLGSFPSRAIAGPQFPLSPSSLSGWDEGSRGRETRLLGEGRGARGLILAVLQLHPGGGLGPPRGRSEVRDHDPPTPLQGPVPVLTALQALSGSPGHRGGADGPRSFTAAPCSRETGGSGASRGAQTGVYAHSLAHACRHPRQACTRIPAGHLPLPKMGRWGLGPLCPPSSAGQLTRERLPAARTWPESGPGLGLSGNSLLAPGASGEGGRRSGC